MVDSRLLTPSLPAPFTTTDTIERLTQIVSGYLLTTAPNDKFKCGGREVLSAQLRWHVKQNMPLELVLPAFPLKCPSLKKVLGVLPDFADEIVLRRLEELCRALEDVYPPGAYFKIVSDGLVYNKLLGVTDSTAFQYNAELRRMVSSLHLRHISFVRVQDLLLSGSEPSDSSDLSEAEYLINAPRTREEFLSTDIGNYDADALIKSDENARRTYCGYLRFHRLDLEGREALIMKQSSGQEVDQASLSHRSRKKLLGTIAKRIMENAAKFSVLVERAFPHAVRLTIRPQTNAGPKFTLRLFPGVDFTCTPWQNVAVIKLDGSIAVQHNQTVDESTHELVYRYGRPYFWREVDLAMRWGALDVTFDHMFPFGLLIRPAPGTTVSWSDIPMDKMRALASRYSLILVRGFEQVGEDEYDRKANDMGTIQQSACEDFLKMKEGIFDMNNATTQESTPMHFDGVFKVRTGGDGNIAVDPPHFLMFHCRHALTEAGAGGRILFANTSLIYQHMMENGASPYASEVKAHMWSVFTPSKASFGGKIPELPLIMTNPLNGRTVIRWHENWPQDITACKPTYTTIVGVDADLSEKIGNHITELMYDRRFVYQHAWQTGDCLIADNYELMHARTAFNPRRQELCITNPGTSPVWSGTPTSLLELPELESPQSVSKPGFPKCTSLIVAPLTVTICIILYLLK